MIATSGQKKLRFSSKDSNLHYTTSPSLKKDLSLPVLMGNNPSPHDSQIHMESSESSAGVKSEGPLWCPEHSN